MFATPKLANGVKRESGQLIRLFQSTVTLPVLKPSSLSPVGAVAVSEETSSSREGRCSPQRDEGITQSTAKAVQVRICGEV